MSKPIAPAQPPVTDRPRPKIATPNRRQIEMQVVDLERLIPHDHPVRIVWAYAEGLDLQPLYDAIKSVEGGPSGHVTDPRVLMALWLFATIEGVGSARELDRLCKRDNLYRWILGGLTTNYHTLSDFRVGHRELLDNLLTAGVAGLMHEGLVDLNRVAQDGMRVRASAGAASFRREPTLQECVKQAKEQVENLKKEIDADPKGASEQVYAARERAAKERLDRVQKARILKVGTLLNEFVRKYRGIAKPRIGVAGLNPHAGEGGIFGNEEKKAIRPALEEAKKMGINVKGPISPDGIFYLAKSGLCIFN